MAINPLLTALKRGPGRIESLDDDFEAVNSDSILATIGRQSLSGLAKAGAILDVPGAVIRNTLGGENPLAPFFHPLSDEGRVSGRDLLRRAGLAGHEDTYANWTAGFAG